MLKTLVRKVLHKTQDILNTKYKYHVFESMPDGFFFKHKGHCTCCGKDVAFVSTNSWLREYFFCENCRCIPRERLLMQVIDEYFPGWRNAAVHESSPGDRGVSVRLRSECTNYTASQFYPKENLGAVVNGFSNQDIENQTFADDSFDLVITQDVMEHIFNPAKGFQEIKRTLKPGGMHIFTTPLDNAHKPSVKWADLDANGKIHWHFHPEYHGNPIDPEGSPVAMKWGYDIKDFIEKNTGMETILISRDDLAHGIRGNGIDVIVSKKN